MLINVKMRFVLVLLVVIGSAISAKLPSDWPTCNKKDANFNECLAKAIQISINQLTKAIPELGLQNLEPLEIANLTIPAGTTAINFSQKYKNIKIIGYSKITVQEADLDLSKKILKFRGMYKDDVKFIADYDFDGKILVLPIVGQGEIEITLGGATMYQEFDVEEYEKKGKKYFKLVGTRAKLEVEKVHFRLDNLFNGNKALGDNINTVINDNSCVVFNDVQAGYVDTLAKVNSLQANAILSRIPISELFGL